MKKLLIWWYRWRWNRANANWEDTTKRYKAGWASKLTLDKAAAWKAEAEYRLWKAEQ